MSKESKESSVSDFIFGYLVKLLCLPSEGSVKFLENFSNCSKKSPHDKGFSNATRRQPGSSEHASEVNC